MNPTGLKIALAIGFAVGLICAVDPQLDLDLSALELRFENSDVRGQRPDVGAACPATRRVSSSRSWCCRVLSAFVGKFIWPRRRMAIEGRAALFLIATLAIGPGLRVHQPHPERSLGPRPPDRRAAIRRRRALHTVVGSERRVSDELLVHRGRALRRVLDACARRAGAAGIARARLWGGARFRRLPSGGCASPPERISSAMSSSPACSCFLVVWLGHGLIYRWSRDPLG